MSIYEQYGRLSEAYEQECEAHRRTVGVLRALKNGDLTLDKLVVTNDNAWAIIPAEAVGSGEMVPDESPLN